MPEPSKILNLSDLLELMEHGAKIKIDRPPLQRIEQFDELISAIKAMVVGQEARATAEVDRSKVQLEVLARLQSLGNKKLPTMPAPIISAPTIDLKPLYTLLAEIMESSYREPVDYDFNILRSGPGLSPATKIEARVVRPTKH